MKILLVGHLRSLFERNSIEIKLDSSVTLYELLEMLPDDLRKEIVTDDGIRPGYLILLNGSDVRSIKDFLKRKVSDEDELVIIPIIHGG